MSILTEAFEKYDRKKGRRENLLLEKEMIENTYKDNEVLQRYISLCKSIEKIDNDDKTNKDNLYTLMMESAEDIDEVIDCLTGKNVEVTLKKPYNKRQFKLSEFEKEKDKNKWYKEIYDKFVEVKTVKGNVNVKLLKD